MSEFEKIMDTDTSKMSVAELKAFVKDTLLPALDENWGEGNYMIMECSTPDILVAQICEECGGIKANSEDIRAYFSLSEEVIEYGDYDDIFCVGSYEDEEIYQAVEIEDCTCNEEE